LAFQPSAGYRYDFYTRKNWYSGGTTVTDVPRLRNNGGFIRVIKGGWDSERLQKVPIYASTRSSKIEISSKYTVMPIPGRDNVRLITFIRENQYDKENHGNFISLGICNEYIRTGSG
jgi:hypothetical protein